MSGPLPAFMIVGTPRSGTTLVQRLACELPGVRVPPETHFFRLFACGLMRRRRFPLDARDLLAELRAFASLETSAGLELEPAAIVERLGARCGSALELFGAIVQHLAEPAELCGEKTPSHLRWWRPLTSRLPELRLVAVVRDPRAVVTSYFGAWGERPHAVVAQRWALDQEEVLRASRELGRERCLVLRYEDVVADPGGARRSLATLLGAPMDGHRPPSEGLHLPWERWKDRASAPVSDERVGAWRGELPAAISQEVAAIACPQMERFGYLHRGSTERRGPSMRSLWRSRRYRLERRVSARRIERAARTPGFG